MSNDSLPQSCGAEGAVMQWRRITEPDEMDSGDEAQRSGEDSELEGDGGVRCCSRNGGEDHPRHQQDLVRSLTALLAHCVVVTFHRAVVLDWDYGGGMSPA